MDYDLVSQMNVEAFRLFNANEINFTEHSYITEYINDLIYGKKCVKTFYPKIASFFQEFGFKVENNSKTYNIFSKNT